MGIIGSRVWEPFVWRTTKIEALVPRFGNKQFFKLETHGSKTGKHWFQGLGSSSSSSWEPVVPRLGGIGSNMWEPCVPGAGNPGFKDLTALVQFLELGTRGSKIVKHCFECWGTSNSSNAEPVVLRLGHIGSNVWEPAIPLLQQRIRTT